MPSALQRMRAMEASLSKAGRAYPDCAAMATNLRTMAYNSEEQLRAQSHQVSHLVHLAAGTISKGLHCLSMQLTSRYFGLRPEQRELPKKSRTRRADLYHLAIFSDNILACSVVIKSAVSSSADPSKLVIHVVTDSLNFPAMTMWFLMNPPRPASVHVASTEDFAWLPVDFGSQLRRSVGVNPRFVSPLNHLRFYLPQIFPFLGKVLLLDHDVVVRKDLRPLWRVNLKGKVNGAVETCGGGSSPSLRLESFVDLSDPALAGAFDPKSCPWAFGMNIFDLDQWRRRGLTEVYQKWLQLAAERTSWKAGTLPLGLLTFYNHTRPLARRWHLLGLGRGADGAARADVERAAVIHYDGSLKPWLEVAVPRYRGYWARFVDYGHPLLRQCNIHE
ncbi:unnamed protein product [Spirodela intermedia]|uniref:Hexosyltransferase n=1 Tax=Spirodela intermedia TaxID=51605 RepID=A0A7I8L209_SPIIN|nr:unnamed protein product [Spirodela intermedia]